MDLDKAMGLMGLSVPDHLKPPEQAKSAPKMETVKENQSLVERWQEVRLLTELWLSANLLELSALCLRCDAGALAQMTAAVRA